MVEPGTIAVGGFFVMGTVIVGIIGLGTSNTINGDVREWAPTDNKSLIGLNFFVPTIVFLLMGIVCTVSCCYFLSGCFCFRPKPVNIKAWAAKRKLLETKPSAPAKSESMPVLVEEPNQPIELSSPLPQAFHRLSL